MPAQDVEQSPRVCMPNIRDFIAVAGSDAHSVRAKAEMTPALPHRISRTTSGSKGS
jgi:hypothetical protein